MNVIDAVRQRRATKKFDPDFVIPLNEKKALLSLAMENAPSAFNLQHWRPLLVEDPHNAAISAKWAGISRR